MSLTSVKLSNEVWRSCLEHALSTETEEVMGLLLGDVEENEALVWAALPQARADRRKDRVETTPEQLAAAMAVAERLTESIGKTTRVVGWYHSHPHITVLPSHVDLRTQKAFQLLDPGFVGIIISCFNEDANMVGRIQTIAFQSMDGRERTESIQSSSGQCSGSSSDYREASSSMSTVTASSTNYNPNSNHYNPNYNAAESSHSGVGMALSPGIQEAMELSRNDMSYEEFVRKEIPLRIVPPSEFALANPPPDPLLSLHRTLFNEEKAAFHKAMQQCTQGERIHPLVASHHSAVYKASLFKLMEFCLIPGLSSLWDELHQCKVQLEEFGPGN